MKEPSTRIPGPAQARKSLIQFCVLLAIALIGPALIALVRIYIKG